MASIRRGHPEDFELLMDRVVQSFREGNPSHERFEVLYPDSVRADDEAMWQWRLAFVDGELAAGLQIVPRPMTVPGCAELGVAGVGNVFCHPHFRKRGLMSDLLRACLHDMQREGFALSMLGGDRTRYGHFGWEHAGASRCLTLSAHVGRHRDQLQVAGTDLRTWKGDAADTLRMRDAYLGLPYRTHRGEDEFQRVLQRPGHVVWIADDKESGFAYLCVRGKAILEYAGDPAALARIVAFLLRNGAWSVVLPPAEGEGEAEEMFLARAQHFQVQPTAMIRIVSLRHVLAAYLPVLHERLQGWRGRLVLEVDDGAERVVLEGTGENSVISPCGSLEAGDTPVLALDRRGMVRLLFGPFAPPLSPALRNHEAVRRAFPLPVYWHSLSHV